MKKVGIRFKPAGKIYDFDCGLFVLKPGDQVIVETEQGLGMGTVVNPPEEVTSPREEKGLKKVYRLANDKDRFQVKKNREVERYAHEYCLKCIKKLKLKMHLFYVESSFEANKMTFFFTSDGRVDFRQLVKMLAKELGVKIEMRQVGIRNQAKMCGGMGRCGRVLCCSSFMEKFEPVSIKMAKEQNLSLNPTKISGQCGRLMCCLNFENETYRSLKKGFPKIGKMVETKHGKGKVIRQNILAGLVAVRLEDRSEVEIRVQDISPEPKKK